ncbi:hypothetical protein Bcep18194_C7457 [Burkholderia lata]|uniref:Uncharacterized protein n=1 Tax=Burkholderia lata (strain ATCC 17760 / DSM 23089 / LMG 22485 / NCIMB 9086 / R18194 / 383) TaxID=482957 RepID=Q39M15_BURL3|nr:hypothetical protein Bcep18194_C7457 [Burkholderia lata]
MSRNGWGSERDAAVDVHPKLTYALKHQKRWLGASISASSTGSLVVFQGAVRFAGCPAIRDIPEIDSPCRPPRIVVTVSAY